VLQHASRCATAWNRWFQTVKNSDNWGRTSPPVSLLEMHLTTSGTRALKMQSEVSTLHCRKMTTVQADGRSS
jgi:hypothetical protein